MGARSVKPGITTSVIFTGDWSMPVKEAEATNSLADQGVDVFTMHVDGPKVIVETAAKRGKMVCGYHASQAKLAPSLPDRRRVELAHGLQDRHRGGAQPASRIPNFVRGGLKDGFVKMSAYGPTVTDAAKKQADDVKAKMMAGSFDIFKGALKDNKGDGRDPRRQGAQADRPRAREDELPGRGRGRLGLSSVDAARHALSASKPLAAAAAGAIAGRAAAVRRLRLVRAASSPVEVWAAAVQGRVRRLVLVAEHAAARGAADADGAVRRDAGARRAGRHRRRGRAGAGRPRLRGAGPTRCRCPATSPARVLVCVAGARRRRALDRAGRLAAPVPRHQRDHQQPAAGLRRDRPVQAPRRRAAARSGEPEQALDASAGRGPAHRRHRRLGRALGPGARRGRLPGARRCGCAGRLGLRGARGRRQPARGAAGRACRPRG